MLAKATLVLHPVSHEWDQCCLDKKITSPLRDRAMANIANRDMTKCLCWLQLRMGYTIKDFFIWNEAEMFELCRHFFS